ncbi:MAG: hypothetical protein ACRC0X_01955 [Brevinema sp.]
MNILNNQPLECPTCKINIINGLNELVEKGILECPYCKVKITNSNNKDIKHAISKINNELNKLKKYIKYHN